MPCQWLTLGRPEPFQLCPLGKQLVKGSGQRWGVCRAVLWEDVCEAGGPSQLSADEGSNMSDEEYYETFFKEEENAEI